MIGRRGAGQGTHRAGPGFVPAGAAADAERRPNARRRKVVRRRRLVVAVAAAVALGLVVMGGIVAGPVGLSMWVMAALAAGSAALLLQVNLPEGADGPGDEPEGPRGELPAAGVGAGTAAPTEAAPGPGAEPRPATQARPGASTGVSTGVSTGASTATGPAGLPAVRRGAPRLPDAAPYPVPVAVPGAAERGRFPVLHTSSRAANAPWLLPPAPSPTAIAADQAVIGGLEVRAASIVGPGHRSRATARQDAYRIGQDGAGRHLIVAVADGMSDSPHSDVGANVAVVALVNELRQVLDDGVEMERIDVKRLFLKAAGQMHGVAEQRGWDPDHVRAVAVAAVVPTWPDDRGRRRCWLAAVADVSAWRLRQDHWERLIGDEKGGFDASAVEHYLPHNAGQVDYGVTELAPGDVLALTTDGVADAFALGAETQRWFADRWRRPPPVGEFLLDVGFDQKQLHDDRTAVVVWCTDDNGRRDR